MLRGGRGRQSMILCLFLFSLHAKAQEWQQGEGVSESRGERVREEGEESGLTLPSTPSSSPAPRAGVDFIGPLWLPRTFKITCCRGGLPQSENNLLIRNWTQSVSDYAVDEESDDGCRVFEGGFLLAATALFNLRSFTGYGVQCKCPEKSTTVALDKHCRRLPPCQNNGYRSFSLNMRCACPEPFFGEFCEKICDQGQKLKGVDGREYCSCVPFYQGEECRDMVCLNGGKESSGRCSCPPSFLGYHCEIDTNRSASVSSTRLQKFGDSQNNGDLFTRDISGTIFSLIMIVVLVVSMYLLMKHRIQARPSRREDSRSGVMSGRVYALPRRGDVVSPQGVRSIPFSAMGMDGPPPYAAMPLSPPTPRRGRSRPEILPPLPSYDDATKLPPLRPSISVGGAATETPATDSQVSSSTTQPSFDPPAQPLPSSSAQPVTFERVVPMRRSV